MTSEEDGGNQGGGARLLYLSAASACASGSRELRSPKKVLETASDAPIMGLRMAIGTARTTASTGP
jgi:hypothetical protein